MTYFMTKPAWAMTLGELRAAVLLLSDSKESQRYFEVKNELDTREFIITANMEIEENRY
jgi:hypothetical protein